MANKVRINYLMDNTELNSQSSIFKYDQMKNVQHDIQTRKDVQLKIERMRFGKIQNLKQQHFRYLICNLRGSRWT